MIYFQDWWSVGENCLITAYTGIIADDRSINDCCIYNNDLLIKFKNAIASNIISYKTKNDYSIEININDPFLNEKIEIDFNENLIIVVSEAEILEVLYSKIFQCYMIKYSDKELEEKTYTAAVVKRYNNETNKVIIELMNNKPKTIKANRPINNNDEY